MGTGRDKGGAFGVRMDVEGVIKDILVTSRHSRYLYRGWLMVENIKDYVKKVR